MHCEGATCTAQRCMYLTRAQGPEGVPFKGARCILRGCKHSCCMFRKYLDTIIFPNDCRLFFRVWTCFSTEFFIGFRGRWWKQLVEKYGGKVTVGGDGPVDLARCADGSPSFLPAIIRVIRCDCINQNLLHIHETPIVNAISHPKKPPHIQWKTISSHMMPYIIPYKAPLLVYAESSVPSI